MTVEELISSESGSGSFGRNLRLLRVWRELEQKDLAGRSGIDRATISRLESGHHKPMRTTVEKLARGLDVPPTMLEG